MGLIVKRAGAEEYGKWVKMLLAGDPGAGKTRLSSTAPNVLYANVEGGLMSVTDRHPNFVDIENSEDLAALRLMLGQEPDVRKDMLGVDVETICIDTIDNLQRLLVSERLEDQKKDTMAIADWGWLGDQVRNIVRSFRNLDMNVIFTCHIKTVEDSETGRAYIKPALQGAMQDEIAAYVDLAVLLKAQPTTKVIDGEARRVLARTMQTFPDLNHPWLKDRSGRLPMEFDVNLDNDFGRITKAIFAELVPAPAATAPAVLQQPPSGVGVASNPTKAAAPAKKAAKKAAAAPVKAEEKAFQPEERDETPPPVAETEPAPTDTVDQPVLEPDPPAPLEDVPADAPDTFSEPEVQPEETAAPTETVVDGRIPCDNPECESGGFVENEDQADLSRIRFRKVLCRSCFTTAKKK